MIPAGFSPPALQALDVNNFFENEDPVVVQQRQQAQHLIDFVGYLPVELRAPQFDGDIITQAESIRLWMSHSEEIRTCKSLLLRDSELKNLPPEIGLFRSLEQLNLASNNLVSLPAEIGSLVALKQLLLKNNEIAVLPIEIRNLEALRWLDLSNNQIVELPALIGGLALRNLNLAGNHLSALPAEISNLVNLTHFDLSHNQFADMPAEIGNLVALKVLDLSDNRLAALSPTMENLRALEELHLSNNQLAALPPEIGHLVALTTLDLSDNQLAVLPPEIRTLTALTYLYLSRNQLGNLPSEIGNLVALKELKLTRNQLATLPPEIGNCAVLKSLHLTHNRLAALPPEIGNLVGLTRLRLKGNQFAVSPPEIEHLQNLDCDLPPPISRRELRGWFSVFARAFPQDEPANAEHWASRTIDVTPLTTLPAEEQQAFANYLRKLRGTQDYKSGGAARNNVILRVERMVQLACKNPEFKNAMLALIAEGLESCGDRVLMTFNEIEIQWQFDHKELADEEFKALAIRASRYHCLKRYAKNIAEERGYGDEIETTLFYHLQLREPLNLPITTKGMLYPDVSGVDPEMLNEALVCMSSYSDEDLLAQSDHWKALMAARHPLLVEEIELRYGDLHATLAEYYGCDKENRADWLEAHPDPELHEIVRESEREGDNYDIAGKIVMRKRALALSQPESVAAAQP